MFTSGNAMWWGVRPRVAYLAMLLLLSIGILHLASPHPPEPQQHCKGCQTLVPPLLCPAAPGPPLPPLSWSDLGSGSDDALHAAGSLCLSPLRAPPARLSA